MVVHKASRRSPMAAAAFVLGVAVVFAAADTFLIRVLGLSDAYANNLIPSYFLRSYVLYVIAIAAAAGAAAATAYFARLITRRRWPSGGITAAAAGGALCAPVLALAVLLNRAVKAPVTSAPMLAATAAILAGWLAASWTLGAAAYRRIGPGKGRARRTAWTLAGWGGALLWAAAAFGFYALPAWTRPPAPATPRMNVLIVSIDALRRDHLGCYGYNRVKTPHLDAFAAGAVKFDNAHCSSSWTLPSMASMITGRYPGIAGGDARHKIRADVPTLAEVLRREGYRTEAYITNIFLHGEYGYARGFDVYLMNGDNRWLYPLRGTLMHAAATRALAAGASGFGWVRDDTQFNRDETRAALRRLGAEQRPFFIWCHFMDPHNPYVPARRYIPDYPGMAAAGAFADREVLRTYGTTTDGPSKDASVVTKLMMLYDGEIAGVDEAFGDIMATLAAEGLDQNTLVVVMNDHGEEFYDHDSYGHGHTFYPELTDMALLIRMPSSSERFPPDAPARCVSHVDIMPTMMDALGIASRPVTDGHSLLMTTAGAERAAFFEGIQKGDDKKAFYRDGWLYIRDARTGTGELYHIANDPQAREDLAGRGAAMEEDLARALSARAAANDATAAALGDAPAMMISAERRRRLMGLGYLGM